MRWITFAILLYLMAALQGAHFLAIPHDQTQWPRIEYLPLLAIFYALYAGESAAPFCGLLCGVLYDLGNNEMIGVSAVPLALAAYLIVRIRLSIFREHFLSQLFVAFVAIMMFAVLALPARYLFSAPFAGNSAWRHLGELTGNALYSALAAPVIFWLFFRFQGLLGFTNHGPRTRGHG